MRVYKKVSVKLSQFKLKKYFIWIRFNFLWSINWKKNGILLKQSQVVETVDYLWSQFSYQSKQYNY